LSKSDPVDPTLLNKLRMPVMLGIMTLGNLWGKFFLTLSSRTALHIHFM